MVRLQHADQSWEDAFGLASLNRVGRTHVRHLDFPDREL